MKAPTAVPTGLELEILKVIWRRGPSTVREVYQELLQERKIAYTTVLTMMGILEQKGHLKRSPGERAYVYNVTQPQSRIEENMVREFVGRVFDGSVKPLLVRLVEDQAIGDRELDEIEKLVRARRRKKA
ncbi:MAG TPA: BlaI/MecI/CopY family transcriptional regulator [Bryobacteraceae bacterium]|nr:BlaI/MecI/CopY family transcriptional regulator [Bryobacteraceae bacterium]